MTLNERVFDPRKYPRLYAGFTVWLLVLAVVVMTYLIVGLSKRPLTITFRLDQLPIVLLWVFILMPLGILLNPGARRELRDWRAKRGPGVPK